MAAVKLDNVRKVFGDGQVAVHGATFAAGETYLPEGMAPQTFYRPVDRGLEIRIAEKLQALRERNAVAAAKRKP